MQTDTLTITQKQDGFLRKAAYLYLLLPYVGFFVGWIRTPIAALLIILISYCLFLVWKQIDQTTNSNQFSITISIKTIAWFLILVSVWLFLSGVGHFSDQLYDYKKHNLILTQLINQDWPIIQHITKQNAYVLVYYLAYYIPAAIIGRLFGFYVANIFQYFYSLVGVFLSLYFVFMAAGRKKIILTSLSFIIFGGMDIVGRAFSFNFTSANEFVSEWWSKVFIYQGNTEILFWAPQQVIPAWIAVGIILGAIINREKQSSLFFLWALTIFWSPWIFLGLTPLIGYWFLPVYKKILSIKNVPLIMGGLIIVGITSYYYSINTNTTKNHGPIWAIGVPWVVNYVAFVFLEFLLLGILLICNYWKVGTFRRILILAVLTLILIPFYYGGAFNDFCMRVSIPSLVVLSIFSARTITELISSLHGLGRKGFTKITSIGVLFFVLIGSINAIYRISNSVLRTYQNHGGFFYRYESEYQENLFKAFNDNASDLIPEQYIARNVDYRKYQWLFKF